jgi:hypothetical protein
MQVHGIAHRLSFRAATGDGGSGKITGGGGTACGVRRVSAPRKWTHRTMQRTRSVADAAARLGRGRAGREDQQEREAAHLHQ